MSQKEILSQQNREISPASEQAISPGHAGRQGTGSAGVVARSPQRLSSRSGGEGKKRNSFGPKKGDQPDPTGVSPREQTDLPPKYRAGRIEEESASTLPHIQHQWPSLGKELFGLEQLFLHTSEANQQWQATQEKLHQDIVAQLYQAEGQYPRVTRYLAFLLVRYGRGAEIVGNPFCIRKDSSLQALPYTGLEGYYAGSERTDAYPGLSQGAILQEEAELGMQIVKMLKKTAVEHDSWAEYTRIRSTLEGKEQRRETIKSIQTLWMTTISRLRSRVYHNPEFEQTLTERIEQGESMCNKVLLGEERPLQRALREEQHRLKEAYAALSEVEKVQEKNERRRRENIRRERIKALQRFRYETYAILEESSQDSYEVGIQDSSWDKATLLETIVLPRIPPRGTYPNVQVHLTPEQLDGYLFLALLGEFGADPLARSELVSQSIFE